MTRRLDTQMRRASRLPRAGGGSLRSIYDRHEATCHLCGFHVQWRDASRDHIVPIVDGGPDRPGNLALAHRPCNVARGELPLGDTRNTISALRKPHTQRDVIVALTVRLNEWRQERYEALMS